MTDLNDLVDLGYIYIPLQSQLFLKICAKMVHKWFVAVALSVQDKWFLVFHEAWF